MYKLDRLTRSLTDFAKLVELFDQQSVSFVCNGLTCDARALRQHKQTRRPLMSNLK